MFLLLHHNSITIHLILSLPLAALAIGSLARRNTFVVVYSQQMNVLIKLPKRPEPVILHTYTFRTVCTEAQVLLSNDLSYVLVKRFSGDKELPCKLHFDKSLIRG